MSKKSAYNKASRGRPLHCRRALIVALTREEDGDDAGLGASAACRIIGDIDVLVGTDVGRARVDGRRLQFDEARRGKGVASGVSNAHVENFGAIGVLAHDRLHVAQRRDGVERRHRREERRAQTTIALAHTTHVLGHGRLGLGRRRTPPGKRDARGVHVSRRRCKVVLHALCVARLRVVERFWIEQLAVGVERVAGCALAHVADAERLEHGAARHWIDGANHAHAVGARIARRRRRADDHASVERRHGHGQLDRSLSHKHQLVIK